MDPATPSTAHLGGFIDRFTHILPDVGALAREQAQLGPLNASNAREWIRLYDRLYPHIERAMWSRPQHFDELLAEYQALFREQDELLQRHAPRQQSDFIIGIPVADRPQHLRSCLESIYQLCECFGYGGKRDGRYQRVRVVIAEDSANPANVQRHIDLAREYSARGLSTCHFGLAEQYQLLQTIAPAQRERLGDLLTRQPAERFYRKGQAANRNLCYLKFLELTRAPANTLYYLVDSDQYFKVPHPLDDRRAVTALNYFHYINRIFRAHDIRMLTGKLVGDPPVSPSVMAANFLADVTAFFQRLAGLQADAPCDFHPAHSQAVADAAYHDMADFFGFEAQQAHFDYRCRLDGHHNHHQCLEAYSQRLNAFFFGEHLTRKTSFVHHGDFDRITPARTIYPGNYIVDFTGLKYIIPFGHLRLRMSGPTAGRLVQAEIGQAFVSANLPMLHGRTLEDGELEDDFRPGVELGEQRIDISDEFERQFFGDLMLFGVIEWLETRPLPPAQNEATIRQAIDRVEKKLLQRYHDKHRAVQQNLETLAGLVLQPGQWWETATGDEPALSRIRSFIANIEHNFGEASPAWRQIRSAAHRQQRKQEIVTALLNYHRQREAWDNLVSDNSRLQTPPSGV